MSDEKGRYILELPLKTCGKFQEDILNKRLEYARKVYNRAVAITKNNYQEMIRTRAYRGIQQELADIRAQKEEQGIPFKKKTARERELYTQLNQMYRDYGFTKFDMISLCSTRLVKVFKPHLDSSIGNKIGARLWTAWDKKLFGSGQDVHFSKYGTFNSVESFSAKSGIRFKDAYESRQWSGAKPAILWNGLEIPVTVKTPYEVMALRDELCFCRVVRREVRGKQKFYVQFTLKGTPPRKQNRDGSYKHTSGTGTVGVNVGLQTVSLYGEEGKVIAFEELADKVQKYEEEKALIQQALDRSRRAMNPDNYNEDGTIKKGIRKDGKLEKLRWVKSGRYEKNRLKLKELSRKQAVMLKLQHRILANRILACGDTFILNDTSWKTMQHRAEETTVDEQGRYESKQRYGKLIADRAPAMLIDIFSKKAEAYGCEVIMVAPNEFGDEAFQNSHKSYQNTLTAVSHPTGCINNLYGAFLLYRYGTGDADPETFKAMHREYVKGMHVS